MSQEFMVLNVPAFRKAIAFGNINCSVGYRKVWLKNPSAWRVLRRAKPKLGQPPKKGSVVVCSEVWKLRPALIQLGVSLLKTTEAQCNLVDAVTPARRQRLSMRGLSDCTPVKCRIHMDPEGNSIVG